MANLNYESLSGTVLPIFIADRDAALGFCGSGVLLGKGLFVTCWHCVKMPLADGARYVVALPEKGVDECRVMDLKDVARDASGLDLAVGAVDAEPTVPLEVANGPFVLMGHDVWTFGYPYTDQQPSPVGGYDFRMNGRILRGYATRTFLYDTPDGQQVESYELDMPVPSGMSGAPLVLRGGLQVVVSCSGQMMSRRPILTRPWTMSRRSLLTRAQYVVSRRRAWCRSACLTLQGRSEMRAPLLRKAGHSLSSWQSRTMGPYSLVIAVAVPTTVEQRHPDGQRFALPLMP